LNTGDQGGNSEQNQRKPSRLWPALINAIDSYAAYYREATKPRDDPYARKIARWAMITGISTCVAAILAGVAAFVFWCQLGTMQRQLNATQADQRPWLKISDLGIPEITFWIARPDFPHARIDARIKAKITNIGKSPADGVKTYAIVFATGENQSADTAAKKLLIEKLTANLGTDEPNRLIFPGDFIEESLPRTTDDTKIPGTLDLGRPNSLVAIHVLVGVRYRVEDKIGYSIYPIGIFGRGVNEDGAISFQLMEMRKATRVYKADIDYFIAPQRDWIEAR
jgi:hypothetical protein